MYRCCSGRVGYQDENSELGENILSNLNMTRFFSSGSMYIPGPERSVSESVTARRASHRQKSLAFLHPWFRTFREREKQSQIEEAIDGEA